MKIKWIDNSQRIVLIAEDEPDTYSIGRLAQLTAVAATKFPSEGYRLELDALKLVNLVLNR